MSFNIDEITHEDSIKLGSDDAPLKVVEYINLRCPDSKNYEKNVATYLDAYVKNGSVQRILKHFDKKKYPLEVGNVLNQYLDYSNPAEAYETIQRLFADQESWGQERLADMPHVAEEYGLSLQSDNRKQAKRTDEEIKAVGIEKVPTVFVGDEAFVETIGLEEFKNAVEGHFE